MSIASRGGLSHRLRVLASALAISMCVAPAGAVAATGTTTRVSVDSLGAQGNGDSIAHSISSDGRYVAFTSWASDLVAGDTNDESDVFVHDRVTGVTTRVSVASSGAQGNGGSSQPAVSSDGRFVAFESYASNLVVGDTNGQRDVFVHDRLTGATSRMSVTSSGGQGYGVNGSGEPSISSDGRYVAFDSRSPDLVAGDTNGTWDVFVHDRVTGATTRASVDSSGGQGGGSSGSSGASISADGRFVSFDSDAPDLVAGDTNGTWDVFVHDRTTGLTTRASVDSSGTQGDSSAVAPSISSDGRYVAFHSSASNLVAGDTNGTVDIFVRDRVAGVTIRASVSSSGAQSENPSTLPSISSDGRFVAFTQAAYHPIVAGADWMQPPFVQVLVHDRVTGATFCASVDPLGYPCSGYCDAAAISGDGRCVAFSSDAGDLVAGDTSVWSDVFVQVSPVNTAPVAVDDAGIEVTGTVLDISKPGVLANDFDADGDALTAVVLAGPSHGTLTLAQEGGFEYRPTPGFTGTDAFTYRAYDGAAYSAPATVTIGVTAAPVLPTSITIGASATTAHVGTTVRLAGAVTPTGTIGRNIVAYVLKPGSARWSYSSNRTVYASGGGAAWLYKYLFKPGMAKGTYTFKAVVPVWPGFLGSTSPTTVRIRLR